MNNYSNFITNHVLFLSLDETEKERILSIVIEAWCDRIITCYEEFKQNRFIELVHSHKSINPNFKPIIYDYICKQTNYNIQAQ